MTRARGFQPDIIGKTKSFNSKNETVKCVIVRRKNEIGFLPHAAEILPRTNERQIGLRLRVICERFETVLYFQPEIYN